MADWWQYLIAVVAAVVTAALGLETTRRRRRRAGGRTSTRPGGTRAPSKTTSRSTAGGPTRAATKRTPAKTAPRGGDGRPAPGEIWWADVPYEDGTGHKVRPCLVLRAARGGYDVLKITSQDKSDRADHVRIPTRAWDPDAERDSYLDLTDPIRVASGGFEDRAGTCDAALWRKVRALHESPTA